MNASLIEPNLAALQQEPWAVAMQDCQHNSEEHHAEGDVWTHTQMVVEQIHSRPEYKDLSPSDQVVVFWAGILHDVAKPTTITVENGETHFPKHSIKGARRAREILNDRGFDWRTRERIANLVRHHGHPPFVLQSENPISWAIDISWRVDTRLLYLLSMADALGRKAKDMKDYPERVELWRMLAEENNCFGQPYPFVNRQARFLFFQDLLSSLYYTPFEDYKCEMTLLSGLPGVGKDTWIAKNLPEAPVVSLDDLRTKMDIDPTDNQGTVIQEAKQQVCRHLAAGTNFVFNATNLMKLSRSKWIMLAHNYQAMVRVVYLERPLSTIFEQNKQRDQVVPEQVIRGMQGVLEVPDLTECHELTEV